MSRFISGELAVTGADFSFVPIIFFAALIYAAVRDIKTKEVGDYVHVVIAAAALAGADIVNLSAMITGATVSSMPLFIAGLVKKGCVGGADIKLMAASGLILGAANGVVALTIGLFLGVVSTFIYRKIKKSDMKTSFPFVPFLAAGCIIAYFL